MRTIRGRATLVAASCGALVCLIIGIIVLFAVRQSAIRQDIDDLAVSARRAGYALREGSTPREALEGVVQSAQIVDDTGNVVASTSAVAGKLRVTERRPDKDNNRLDKVVCGTPVSPPRCFVVVAIRVHTPAKKWQTVYFFRPAPPWYVDKLALLALLAAAAAVAVLAGLLTRLAVGRPLGWVEQIQAELAEINASDLRRRVPVPVHQAEIAQLAETINETLDRLEAADVSAGRQNAGHARNRDGDGHPR